MNTKTIFLFLFSIIFGTESMAQCSPQGVDPVTFPRIYMSDGSVLTALFDDETQSVEFSLEAADTSAEYMVYIYRNNAVYKTITVTDLSVETFDLSGARVGTYTFYVLDGNTMKYIGRRTRSYDGGTYMKELLPRTNMQEGTYNYEIQVPKAGNYSVTYNVNGAIYSKKLNVK